MLRPIACPVRGLGEMISPEVKPKQYRSAGDGTPFSERSGVARANVKVVVVVVVRFG